MTRFSWPCGLVTALVTPLRDDAVDRDAFASLIEYQIASGGAGVVITGGTGEHGALTIRERAGLIRDAVSIAGGRIPVIAATGCFSTRDTVQLSREAEAAGVAGLLVASPFAEPISWRERYAFYEELDAAISTPVMIYNTPPSGLLNFDQIRELATLGNISAVKDSSGDPELMGDLIAWKKQAGVGVYVGKDSYLFEAIACGADGAVFGVGNFLPGPLSALIGDIQRSGPSTASLELWRTMRPLLRLMEQASNYVGLCKVGLSLRGIDAGTVRKPYQMPDRDEIDRLRVALDRFDRAVAS